MTATEPTLESNWQLLRSRWRRHQRVHGEVYAREAFGVFVDLGIIFPGLLEVIDQHPASNSGPSPPVGSKVEAVVAGFIDSAREVKLSARPEHLARATTDVEIPTELRGKPPWPRDRRTPA